MTRSTAVRVWDLPTRLFHWLLVIAVAFAWISAENGLMDWHRRAGLTVLGLVVFRLVWGLIGGSTARFAGFVTSPARALEYLRAGSAAPQRAGHNPLGGYSVLALLALLAAQVSFGLFATDTDGLESGPLSFLVSYDQSRDFADLHEIGFNLLVAMIALHLLAILFYRLVRKRNLIAPMITGRDAQLDASHGALAPAGPLRFVVAAAAGAGAAWAANNGFFL